MIAKDAENARFLFAGLLRKGISITVQWDAGGDERVVLVQYDGREENGYEKAEELLIEDIAQELSLPIWGEEFNTGNGRLVLEDNDTVALVFSAYEHTFPESTGKAAIKMLQDDPFNSFVLTADYHSHIRHHYDYLSDRFSTSVAFRDKKTYKELVLLPNVAAYYTALVSDAMKPHLGEAGKPVEAPGIEIIADIIAYVEFPEAGKLLVQIYFGIKKITNAHKEEKIILFDA